MRATETAVIVSVPEAEPVVAAHRARLDRSAAWGVPAHVTVLYPFVSPSELDQRLVDQLTSAVRTVPSFDCEFAEVRWFGEDAVWLAPRPEQPFRGLTAAVHAAFPGHPPYDRAHHDVVPHLTIGNTGHAELEDLRAAEAAVLPHLPVRVRITEAMLLQGRPEADSWTPVAVLPLGEDG